MGTQAWEQETALVPLGAEGKEDRVEGRQSGGLRGRGTVAGETGLSAVGPE